MEKKPKWKILKSFWKIVIALSVILTIIASFLQISGVVDFWSLLIFPIYAFLVTEIPVYSVILLITALVIISFIATRLRTRHKRCIIDAIYARRISLACQEPRSTQYLRSMYTGLGRQSDASEVVRYKFDDYLKLLEKGGFLEYVNGKWRVTIKALEYIDKYHGR